MSLLSNLTPRNYKSTGSTLRHDLAVMLRDHPEAFDCLIFPALDSEQNEVNAQNSPVATHLDREERAQRFGEPVKARAMIVPDENLSFEVVDSALYESFFGASQSMNLLLSDPEVRTYSLVQWLEFPSLEATEPVERTVYVASTMPLGRTLGAGVTHVCLPLPALGEIPALAEEQEPVEEPDGGSQNAEFGPGPGTPPAAASPAAPPSVEIGVL